MCAMMTLTSTGRRHLLDPPEAQSLDTPNGVGEDPNDEMAAELFTQSLFWARQAAVLIGGYREVYGCKIFGPFIPHAASIASYIFMEQLGKRVDGAETVGVETFSDESTEIAFEECVRCLVAFGMQYKLGQIICRMVQHSITATQVPIPASVNDMLRLVAQNAWQRSDMLHVSSFYPNWGTVAKGEEDEIVLERLLKEWSLESNEEIAEDEDEEDAV